MITTREMGRGGGRGGPGRGTRAALLGALVAMSAVSHAQTQPPPLRVYSDDFRPSASTPPAAVQRGTSISVELPNVDFADLERRAKALLRRIRRHRNDSDAHQPHGHPHSHCPPGTSEASAADQPGPRAPVEPADAELARADVAPTQCDLVALLGAVLELLAPVAHAQTQPPPLRVYTDDMGGPSHGDRTGTDVRQAPPLVVDVPLIDTVDRLLRELEVAVPAHIADRPGHGHGHDHSH